MNIEHYCYFTKSSKTWWWLLFFWGGIIATHAQPIPVNLSFETKAIGKDVSVYLDYSQTLTIQDILRDTSLQFEPQEYEQLMVGHRRYANCWIKAEMVNISQQELSLVLHTNDIFTRYMWAYLVADGKLITEFHAGVRGSFQERIIPHRSSAFPISLPPQQQRTLYLKIENKWDPIQFPIFLSTEAFFHERNQKEYFLLGLFHGFLGLIALIAMALLAATRTRLFLIYFLYATCSFLFSFFTSGLDFQYVFQNNAALAYRGNMMSGGLTLLFLYFLVFEYYKKEEQNIRFAKRVFSVVIPLLVVTLLLLSLQGPLGLYSPERSLFTLLLPGISFSLLSVFLFYILLRATIRRPIWTNVVFLLGFSGITLYGILAVPAQNAWIALPFDKFNLYRGALILELLCISILMIHRILELRREKEQAELVKEKEQERARIYANITHEFRTPLTAIIGAAEFLKEHEEKNIIQRNSESVMSLMNQLLELSKSDAGHLRLSLIQGDVLLFLRHLGDAFQNWCRQSEIAFEFVAGDDECLMEYDEEKLKQIMSNLISNAIKFTPPGGWVKVQVKRKKSVLEISVTDSGIGIGTNDLQHVFERFYQVDSSSTRKTPGTGIGLAYTRSLVELWGGTVTAESELGSGSTFRVCLPLGDSSPSGATQITSELLPSYLPVLNTNGDPERSAPGEVNLSVLIIEDNDDVRRYLRKCLEHDFQVLEATDGQEGMEKAKAMIPDVIITDIMMPKADGLEVCKTLKTDLRTNHIPIIMLTAKATEKDKLAGFEIGADDYLYKPFNRQELYLRIRNRLELRHNMQAAFRRGPSADTAKSYPQENEFVVRCREIILRNLDNVQFGVPSLAAEMAMSASTLLRKMKTITGRTPAGFISLTRLEESCVLLKCSAKTITEVAYAVGFQSPAHFSRSFKKEYEMTPVKFRNRTG